MKHFIFFKQRIYTMLLVVGAILGLFLTIIDTKHDFLDEAPPSEKRFLITQKQAEETAMRFITEYFSIAPETYKISVSDWSDSEGLAFLDRSDFSDDEIREYQEKYRYPSVGYTVRFFKELEPEEYFVYIDPFRNTVMGFSRVLSEESKRNDIPMDDARNGALIYLATVGHDVQQITERDHEEVSNPGGKDITFRFREKGSDIPSAYGDDAYMEHLITMQGDRVGEYTNFIHTPERFSREYTELGSKGEALGMFAALADMGMHIVAFVVLIQLFIRKMAVWKPILIVSGILFVLGLADVINSYPGFVAAYVTDTSFLAHVTISGIITVLVMVFVILSFFVAAVAGISIGKNDEASQTAILFGMEKDAIRNSIAYGYCIGFLLLGFSLAIFWIGEKYFDVWYMFPTESNGFLFTSYIPVLSFILYYGLIAAITEEMTYRVFGILFFKRFVKSTAIAIIIPTLIWAFAHSTDFIFPYWFRGVEVFIGGLLFAYFFMRFGALTTIIAHYTHNITLVGIVLVFTYGYGQILPAILMLVIPLLIIPGVNLFSRWRNKPEKRP